MLFDNVEIDLNGSGCTPVRKSARGFLHTIQIVAVRAVVRRRVVLLGRKACFCVRKFTAEHAVSAGRELAGCFVTGLRSGL